MSYRFAIHRHRSTLSRNFKNTGHLQLLSAWSSFWTLRGRLSASLSAFSSFLTLRRSLENQSRRFKVYAVYTINSALVIQTVYISAEKKWRLQSDRAAIPDPRLREKKDVPAPAQWNSDNDARLPLERVSRWPTSGVADRSSRPNAGSSEPDPYRASASVLMHRTQRF